MTKFLALFCKILITVPVVVFLFFITFSNREQSLNFVWSPLSDAVSVPLPIVLFLALIIGFIWGALILWSNTIQIRADRRNFKKRISELENRLAQQQIDQEKLRQQTYKQELIR